MAKTEARIKLKAERASLEVAMDFVREFARACGLEEEQLLKLELVVEELVLNVIDYAYQGGEGELEIRCKCRDKTVEVEIIDWGVAFNPLEASAPDLDGPIEGRDPGGLGIFLSRTMAGQLSYRRENQANITTIVSGGQPAGEGS